MFKTKRVWWLALGLLLALLASPIAVVFFYQDTLKAQIVKALDQQLVGRTELDGFHIAPFANFPYISIDLEGLRFYDGKSKEAKPVYSFADVYVGFDVAQLMQGKLDVKQITLSQGFVEVVIDAQGRINLLEAKKSKAPTEADSAAAMHLDLKAIRLEAIDIKETNYEGNKQSHIHIQNALAKFSLNDSSLNFHLDTDAVLRQYTSAGTTYLRDKYFELHNDLSYHLKRDFLDIKPGKLVLQNAEINFSGSIDFARQAYLDLHFEGRKENFDLFLAFAPANVAEIMQNFTSRGDIYFKGSVVGPSLHQDPHIEVELGCDRTFFARKDLNKDVLRDLQFKGFFTTGDSNTLATSSFVLESLYGAPENSFVKGTMRVDNFDRPLVNMDFHAKLDLRHLPDFLPVESLQQSSGQVEIDLTLKEFVSADTVLSVASQLQDGTSSHIRFNNVSITPQGYPHAIEQINGELLLNGDHLEAKNLRARILDNDLSLSLTLDDLLHYLHGDAVPVDFRLVANAQKLAPGQLVPEKLRPEGLRQEPFWNDVLRNFHAELEVHTTANALRNFKHLPQVAIRFHDLRFKTDLYPLPVNEVRGLIDLSDQRIYLHDVLVSIGPNQMQGSVELSPVAPLMDSTKKEWANFKTDIKIHYLNAKELLSYNEKSFVNEEIKEEIIRKLEFKGHGRILGNSFGSKGFASEMDIDHFQMQLNQFPVLQKVSGQITTDTLGSIHLNKFTATIGRSQFSTSLDLLHYLDGDLKNKNIKGTFKAPWLDLDSLFAYYDKAKPQNSTAAKPTNNSKSDNKGSSAPNPHEEAFNLFALDFPNMQLGVEIAHFRYHKYQINNIKGQLRSTPQHYAYIDSLHMDAADGHITLHGYLNGSNPKNIYLTSFMRLKKVDLTKLMYKFDNFGQDYLLSDNVRGLLDAEVKSTVHLYPDFTADLAKTNAHADVRLRNGRLLRFAPMHAMADFMGEKDLDDIKFGEMQNVLDIKDGQVIIPSMKLTSSIGYIYISGKQNFANDLNMDYEIRLPLSLVKEASWNMMKAKLFGRKKTEGSAPPAPLPSDEQLVDNEKEIVEGQKGLIRKYINVHVAGSTSDFKINIGKRKQTPQP